jgi:hypothetical protein
VFMPASASATSASTHDKRHPAKMVGLESYEGGGLDAQRGIVLMQETSKRRRRIRIRKPNGGPEKGHYLSRIGEQAAGASVPPEQLQPREIIGLQSIDGGMVMHRAGVILGRVLLRAIRVSRGHVIAVAGAGGMLLLVRTDARLALRGAHGSTKHSDRKDHRHNPNARYRRSHNSGVQT